MTKVSRDALIAILRTMRRWRNLGATVSITGAVAISMLLAAWGGNALASYAYINWHHAAFVQPTQVADKSSPSELEARRQKARKPIEKDDIAWPAENVRRV